MVKNVSGGSKHKNVARKSLGVGGKSHKLRKATEEGETYAVVSKILGGSNCSVIGSDNQERMCVIRGKFRAPGRKRDNTLSMGTLVLVGDRSWESSSTKKMTCDLLEVYTSADKEHLKANETTVNWDFLSGVGGVYTHKAVSEDDFEFGDNHVEEEYENLVMKETGPVTTVIDFDHEGDVDIDDI